MGTKWVPEPVKSYGQICWEGYCNAFRKDNPGMLFTSWREELAENEFFEAAALAVIEAYEARKLQGAD